MNNFNNNTNPFLEEDEDDFLESMVTSNNVSEKVEKAVEHEERVETPAEWRARMIRETGDNGYLHRLPRPSDLKTVRVSNGGAAPVLNAQPAQPVVQKPAQPVQHVSAPVEKPVENPVVAQPAPVQHIAPVASAAEAPQKKNFTRKVSQDPEWVGMGEATELVSPSRSTLRRYVEYLDELHDILVELGELKKEDRFPVKWRFSRRLLKRSHLYMIEELEENNIQKREEILESAKKRLEEKRAAQK